MSDDILQIAMTSYYDRTKCAAIPEGIKAAINAVFPIQENYFIEKYYNVIFGDNNNNANELLNYLEDRDIQINRIDEDNKRLLKENEKLRNALEFYGWEEHWVKQHYERSVIEDDRGRRARAALEGVTEKEGLRNE